MPVEIPATARRSFLPPGPLLTRHTTSRSAGVSDGHPVAGRLRSPRARYTYATASSVQLQNHCRPTRYAAPSAMPGRQSRSHHCPRPCRSCHTNAPMNDVRGSITVRRWPFRGCSSSPAATANLLPTLAGDWPAACNIAALPAAIRRCRRVPQVRPCRRRSSDRHSPPGQRHQARERDVAGTFGAQRDCNVTLGGPPIKSIA